MPGSRASKFRGNRHRPSQHSAKASKRQIPNLEWRAFPIEHLRIHPFFRPLPHPDDILTISSPSDLSRFRQESWQWRELHHGRLSSSIAAACLGFLEPGVASELRISHSLQGHQYTVEAFHRLCSKQTCSDVESASVTLLTAADTSKTDAVQPRVDLRPIDESPWRSWGPDAGWRCKMWSMDYDGSSCILGRDRKLDSDVTASLSDADKQNSARLAWGNSQEPTAILVALNVLRQQGAIIYEAGMLTGESLLDIKEDGLPEVQLRQLKQLRHFSKLGGRIGATPDGLVRYPNGALEVLEVKNHCPFKFSRGTVVLRDRSPNAVIPCGYVPQLQLEMFCAGPNCRSAVLVRLTATQGAVVLRIARDDTYIEWMLCQFTLFYATYVLSKSMPPDDFATIAKEDDNVNKIHAKIVQRTIVLADSAVVVRNLNAAQVQRGLGSTSLIIP